MGSNVGAVIEENQKGPWAVAVTLTKRKGCGTINIITHLDVYRDATEKEAVGQALVDAMSKNPEHQPLYHGALLIEGSSQ